MNKKNGNREIALERQARQRHIARPDQSIKSMIDNN